MDKQFPEHLEGWIGRIHAGYKIMAVKRYGFCMVCEDELIKGMCKVVTSGYDVVEHKKLNRLILCPFCYKICSHTQYPEIEMAIEHNRDVLRSQVPVQKVHKADIRGFNDGGWKQSWPFK